MLTHRCVAVAMGGLSANLETNRVGFDPFALRKDCRGNPFSFGAIGEVPALPRHSILSLLAGPQSALRLSSTSFDRINPALGSPKDGHQAFPVTTQLMRMPFPVLMDLPL